MSVVGLGEELFDRVGGDVLGEKRSILTDFDEKVFLFGHDLDESSFDLLVSGEASEVGSTYDFHRYFVRTLTPFADLLQLVHDGSDHG
jgi:hypothetical protein